MSEIIDKNLTLTSSLNLMLVFSIYGTFLSFYDGIVGFKYNDSIYIDSTSSANDSSKMKSKLHGRQILTVLIMAMFIGITFTRFAHVSKYYIIMTLGTVVGFLYAFYQVMQMYAYNSLTTNPWIQFACFAVLDIILMYFILYVK